MRIKVEIEVNPFARALLSEKSGERLFVWFSWYTSLHSRSGATAPANLSRKRKDIEIAQNKFLRKLLDGNGLEMG